MKIEIKRKVDGKWQYIDVKEIAGVPLIDILSRAITEESAAIKVTGSKGITLITDDMLQHTHACNRGWNVMSIRDGLDKIAKHYGEQLMSTVPEYVEEVFPGCQFVGCEEVKHEAA